MSEPSRQILVVDGDAPARREIKSACEQDGYQVLEAETGSDALRVHTAAHPNLVLLEVTLPDGSGFDVCRELRRSDPTSPVIMMSTRSDEIDVVVALEIGADDYVTKPLRLRELAARIAAHLRRARMESAEAMRTLEEGTGTKEDLDAGARLGLNHPMGPFELADWIGLDVCLEVMRVLHAGIGAEHMRPPRVLEELVAAGHLGRKTKRGFYTYE